MSAGGAAVRGRGAAVRGRGEGAVTTRFSPTRLLAVAVKEVRQMARDRLTVFIMAGMPAVMLVLFGYALTLDVDHIPLAVCDLDGTWASRDLVASFTSGGTFERRATVAERARVERLLDAGTVRAGLVIPPGFGRDLDGARGARVQLLLDGADSNTARIAQGHAILIARTIGSEVLIDAIGRAAAAGPLDPGGAGTSGAAGAGGGGTAGAVARPAAGMIEARTTVWFNPELKSAHFVIPGLLGVMLLIAAMMMTAMSVVRERERGTLEALVATPIRPAELILGKTLPYVLFAYLDVLLALVVAVYGFDVPFRGSLGVLTALLGVFLFGALGYGLLISTIAHSQQEAWTIGLVTTLLPSFLLSGFVFPIENMIPAVQEITRVIQARYFIGALRAVILKGVGFDAIRPQLEALAIFAVVFPGLAALRFRKQVG